MDTCIVVFKGRVIFLNVLSQIMFQNSSAEAQYFLKIFFEMRSHHGLELVTGFSHIQSFGITGMHWHSYSVNLLGTLL